jgi:hypothetical protein
MLGLWILNQSIDFPLKILLLSLVEVLRNTIPHLPLQHMRAIVGDRLAPDMFECVLDHSMSGIVEHIACILIANTLYQTKMFLHRRNN